MKKQRRAGGKSTEAFRAATLVMSPLQTQAGRRPEGWWFLQ